MVCSHYHVINLSTLFGLQNESLRQFGAGIAGLVPVTPVWRWFHAGSKNLRIGRHKDIR